MPTTTTHTTRRKPAAQPPGELTITLSRVEALALCKAADAGLRVIDALSLVQSTGATRKALDKLELALNRRG